MGPVLLEHMVDEPVVPEQEDYGPAILGHNVDKIVALRRRDFVPDSLGRQGSKPVDLGHEDFGPVTTRLDLDPAPARVKLVDMYTRFVATLVCFFVARVDFTVAKFVPGAAEVGFRRTWVERCWSILHLLLRDLLQLL